MKWLNVEIVTGGTCNDESKCGGTVTGRRAICQGLVEDVPSGEDAAGMTPECQEGANWGEGLGKVQAGHELMQRLNLACLRDRRKTGVAGVSRTSW